MLNFASDNISTACPEVMAAVNEINNDVAAIFRNRLMMSIDIGYTDNT